MNFLKSLLDNSLSLLVNDSKFLQQQIIAYSIISIIVLAIIFIVLVNKNILMRKSDNGFKRFITHPLFVYSLRRIGSAIVSIFLALAITFFLLRMQDLESALCTVPKNKFSSPELWTIYCNSVKKNLGFGGNPIVEFGRYIYNIIPFPKKVCISMGSPNVETGLVECSAQGWKVVTVYLGYAVKGSDALGDIAANIITRIPNSFKWGAIATVIQLLIGYPLGILMAKNQDKFIDKLGKGYIILVDAIPGLLYYYLLYSLFRGTNILPTRFAENNVLTWIAPSLTAAFAGVAGIAYWVRRYMLNEINSDYVKFARSKGLSENKIMFKHVLRNAIVPLSRSLSTAFISCLFGSFFIESIFIIPGFGSYLYDAVQSKDFMIVQGVVVFSAILSVVSYLIADIVMAIADPRISFSD